MEACLEERSEPFLGLGPAWPAEPAELDATPDVWRGTTCSGACRRSSRRAGTASTPSTRRSACPRGCARAPCRCHHAPPPPPSPPPLPIAPHSPPPYVLLGLAACMALVFVAILVNSFLTWYYHVPSQKEIARSAAKEGERGVGGGVAGISGEGGGGGKKGKGLFTGKRSPLRKLLRLCKSAGCFACFGLFALLGACVVLDKLQPRLMPTFASAAIGMLPESMAVMLQPLVPILPPAPPPPPSPPPSPLAPPPYPPPHPPHAGCDGDPVGSACWHLTRQGQSCAAACGSEPSLERLLLQISARVAGAPRPKFYFADAKKTASLGASPDVVRSLSAHYRLAEAHDDDPRKPKHDALAAALSGGGPTATTQLASLGQCSQTDELGLASPHLYLYMPELAYWDCYANQTVERIAPAFRSPCVCEPAPHVDENIGLWLGLTTGAAAFLGLALIGLLYDAIANRASASSSSSSASGNGASGGAEDGERVGASGLLVAP